jgi:hypothetical protein
MFAVSDTLTPNRAETVQTPEELGAVVNAWLAVDGAPVRSESVKSLVAAIRRGDWLRAHALADHLSLNLDAV